jgi:hypothetical protein
VSKDKKPPDETRKGNGQASERHPPGANGKHNPHPGDTALNFTPSPPWKWPLSPEDHRRREKAREEKFREIRDYYRRRAEDTGGDISARPERYSRPSAESPFWRSWIGEKKLTTFNYLPPLVHPGRMPPRYVDTRAKIIYQPPDGRPLNETESLVRDLDRDVERFSRLTAWASLTFQSAIAEAADDNHALDVFDDDERSILVRSVLDGTDELLKAGRGTGGGFIIGTVHRIQRWTLAGNSILADIEAGWGIHLQAMPWAPDGLSEHDGRGRRRVSAGRRSPSTKLINDILRDSMKRVQRWHPSTADVRHRIALCAQILSNLDTSLVVPSSGPSSRPLPVDWYRDKYGTQPRTLSKALREGRVKNGIRMGGRWFVRESDFLDYYPELAVGDGR